MTQEEIKNMGELYRSVIEGKSRVEEACSKNKMEETDPVDKKELKKDFKDRDDKDIDNDGDVDDSDEYLVKKRKAISKKVDESTFGSFLMDIAEASDKDRKKSATTPEEIDSKDSENAKKLKTVSGKGSEKVLDGEAIEGDKENGKPTNDEAKLRKGDNKNVKEFFSFLDSIDEAKMKQKDESENTEKDSDDNEDISLLIKKNAEKRQDAEDGEEDKESKRDKKDVKEDVELEISEAVGKIKWKKLGNQYQAHLESSPKDILSMISVQARGFNDGRSSYEVESMNGIPFKKFNSIKDAKKYAEENMKEQSVDIDAKKAKRDAMRKQMRSEDVELEEGMKVNTQAICKEAGKLSPAGQAKVFSLVLDLQDKEGI